MNDIANIARGAAKSVLAMGRPFFSFSTESSDPLGPSKDNIIKLYKDKHEKKVDDFKYDFLKSQTVHKSIEDVAQIFKKYEDKLGSYSREMDRETNWQGERAKVSKEDKLALETMLPELDNLHWKHADLDRNFWFDIEDHRSDFPHLDGEDKTEYQPIEMRDLDSETWLTLESRNAEYKRYCDSIDDADRMARILLGWNPG